MTEGDINALVCVLDADEVRAVIGDEIITRLKAAVAAL